MRSGPVMLRLSLLLALAAAIGALTAAPAYAYIDPGSGSIIIQAIVGAVVGIGLAVKVFWRRILGVFGRGGPPDPEDPGLDV